MRLISFNFGLVALSRACRGGVIWPWPDETKTVICPQRITHDLSQDSAPREDDAGYGVDQTVPELFFEGGFPGGERLSQSTVPCLAT
jgi:hypothetical protein